VDSASLLDALSLREPRAPNLAGDETRAGIRREFELPEHLATVDSRSSSCSVAHGDPRQIQGELETQNGGSRALVGASCATATRGGRARALAPISSSRNPGLQSLPRAARSACVPLGRTPARPARWTRALAVCAGRTVLPPARGAPRVLGGCVARRGVARALSAFCARVGAASTSRCARARAPARSVRREPSAAPTVLFERPPARGVVGAALVRRVRLACAGRIDGRTRGAESASADPSLVGCERGRQVVAVARGVSSRSPAGDLPRCRCSRFGPAPVVALAILVRQRSGGRARATPRTAADHPLGRGRSRRSASGMIAIIQFFYADRAPAFVRVRWSASLKRSLVATTPSRIGARPDSPCVGISSRCSASARLNLLCSTTRRRAVVGARGPPRAGSRPRSLSALLAAGCRERRGGSSVVRGSDRVPNAIRLLTGLSPRSSRSSCRWCALGGAAPALFFFFSCSSADTLGRI
jgi:hypothetical protein